MRVRILAALAAVCLMCTSAASAQQSVSFASVSGRVTDVTGAVTPGAAVSIRQTETNITSTAVADAEGRFRFPYLRVGPYEVTVHLQGFADVVRRLALTPGAAHELPIVLTVGPFSTTFVLVAETAVLEAARSQMAGTISAAEVQHLPLNGRNFLDVALLVPGVAPANVSSTQLFPETSAVPGISLSVGSQRNLSNNVIVDGLSANDDAAALSGITYGIDAIDQFQVVTSGGQAELGRALGGYVNVVTRSGTNALRGTAYDFVRDDGLNAKNPLSGTTLPMHQAQFGASLGGAIARDRTFFFGNGEHRALDQTGLTTISEANVAAINARLAAVGYQGPAVVTGIYRNPVDSTNVFGKVDHRGGDRDQFSVRYGLYDVTSLNSRGAGGLSAPSASAGLDSRDQTASLSNTFVLSERTVLETRAQVTHSDLLAPPTDPVGPAVAISGVASFGTSSGSPTGRVNTLYQVVNNLSHQSGAHAVRAGVDVLYNADHVTYPRAVRGSYGFSSMANFLTGVYNNAGFTQTFGVSEVKQGNPNLGLYVQDEWKATPDLTLNLGLRYDLQWLETIDVDRDNVAPRVGVAWVPLPSRRTVLRGSAGLFFDRVPLRAIANALLSASNTTDLSNLQQTSIALSPAQAGAPVFPAILSDVVPTMTLVNLTTMDRGLQNAWSRQASAEIEQQIGARTTVSAGYQYLRGIGLLMSVNQNVPSCVATGTNNGCRPDPAYANNSRYSAAGASSYHALLVSLTQRASGWGQYRVSYTLSSAMNNVGEFFFSQPIDPLDLSKDWGRSDNDQRHRLVLFGTVQTSTKPAATTWERISHGFQMSSTLQAASAPPFNITSGVTTVQGTPGRPIVDGAFIDRNAGEGSAFFLLTMRVSRSFPLPGRASLEALVEGFNLTNHRNVITRNTNFGSGAYPTDPLPTFGQVTAVGEPRSAQFGIRVRF